MQQKANNVAFILGIIGPSGVHALPLAAGINVGGHYFAYCGYDFLGVGGDV